MTTAQAREHDALARLSRVNGPGELKAAVLALVTQPADAAASLAVWQAEVDPLPTAQALLDDVGRLSDASRLPALEVLLARARLLPKPERRAMLQSTRRLMAAHAPLRPIDRLHWLMMRRRLGDHPPAAASPASHNDMAQLPPATLLQVARVTAYLSRMVPGRDPAAALAWYAQALSPFLPREMMPPCQPPDGDGLAHALDEVEALPWMLRPVLVRAWVDAAVATSLRARLPAAAADALRLAADLLDSPLPPELARQYTELEWTC
ncbi:hypothetical protein [Piscinibacter sp. XHJ-5]|uniref:hypothetical protein n=1 Tax=Piscinibacter sp. XHJ-5 TaxID=3037797 RepID=UPI002452A402|nr:hypothetical protein [Piscinibacter sp. XHJ-5]